MIKFTYGQVYTVKFYAVFDVFVLAKPTSESKRKKKKKTLSTTVLCEPGLKVCQIANFVSAILFMKTLETGYPSLKGKVLWNTGSQQRPRCLKVFLKYSKGM